MLCRAKTFAGCASDALRRRIGDNQPNLDEDFRIGGGDSVLVPRVEMDDGGPFVPGPVNIFGNLIRLDGQMGIHFLPHEAAQRRYADD